MEEELTEQDEKKWARRAHLSTLFGYFVFLLLVTKGISFSFAIGMLSGILLPLYILFTKGKKSEFIAEHAKEASFIAGFMALLGFGAGAYWSEGGTDSIFKSLTYFGASFYHLFSVVAASIKSSYKKMFSYPLSFFKYFRQKKEVQKQEQKKYGNLDKVSTGIYKDTIKKALEQRKEIETLSRKIQDSNIKNKVKLILQSLDAMFENFEKDPRDIKISRQFLGYYLDATIKIIRKYIDLSEQKVLSPELTESLRKVDSILTSIKEAFDKHHAKLLNNDIMELDTEIEVMEKTMKLEGFG